MTEDLTMGSESSNTNGTDRCRVAVATSPGGNGHDERQEASISRQIHRKRQNSVDRRHGDKEKQKEIVRERLMGAALVFRFGSPTPEPCSDHEKETLRRALQNEDRVQQKQLDDAERYFESVGVNLKENLFESGLEEEILELIVDILVEELNTRSSRSKSRRTSAGAQNIANGLTSSSSSSSQHPTIRSNSQRFTAPAAVDNRELYFVSTKSCRIIKNQGGRPFHPTFKTHFAWAVENMKMLADGNYNDDDDDDGTNIGSNVTTKGIRLNFNSIIARSGSAVLPDVMDDMSHIQNMDNPRNAPLVKLLKIIEKEFRDILVCNDPNTHKYENVEANETNNHHMDHSLFTSPKGQHRFMALQLILGEGNLAGRKNQHSSKRLLHSSTSSAGRRGLHEDKWSTAGAAVISVTLGPCSRELTMKHRTVVNKYTLQPRSAYALTGAARYGTIWKTLGLVSELKHGLGVFGG